MEIGSLWNGWKVDKFIGEGSFGKVYRIIREEFGHIYESALKVIEIPQNHGEVETIRNEGLSDDSVTAYFQSMVEDIVDEFALMSKLKGNTNIVSYEDHFVVPLEDRFGWRIYIRMELLTPLYDYMRKNTFSIREVIQLGVDMCQALEVCQKYNIIHRDIKPENIFVSDLGKFKLGDFGIARQLEKTSSGLSKKGTYTYMAPEVYKGMAYNSTVDIYSLGIVLYRFLNNNRTPFMPPYPQTIKYSDKEKANVLRISGEPLPTPCNAEGRLAEIVLKACAYNPNERYESAVEMKNALLSVLYSEQEAKLIYPKGDKLENRDFSASFSNKTDTDATELSSEDDATVLLIDVDKSENRDSEVTTVIDEVDEETITVENIEYEDDATVLLIDVDKKEDSEATAVIDEVDDGTVAIESIEYEDDVPTEIDENGICETVDNTSIVEEKTDDTQDNQQNESNKKKYLIIAVAILAVLAIIIAVLVVSCGKGKNQDEPSTSVTEQTESVTEIKKVKVPNVVGLTVSEAQDLLNSEGLNLAVLSEKYSNSVKKGSIISQDTEKDSLVEESTTISVVVSLGKEKKVVPNVKGLTLENAKKQIEDSGLKCKTEYSYSDSVAKDKVIKQNVAAGKKVEVGSTVTITVSKGSNPASTNNNTNNYYSENNTQATQSKGNSNAYAYEFLDEYEFLE